jgi:hypothetical protein
MSKAHVGPRSALYGPIGSDTILLGYGPALAIFVGVPSEAHRASCGERLCFPISGGRPTMGASQEQCRRTSAAFLPAGNAASRPERRALLGTACQEGNQEPMCAAPA